MHRLLALRRRVPGRLHPRRAAENDREHRVSPGERYARIYEINMARCIFCGYCEIACPFDAITLGNDYELSEISREALDLHQGDAARAAGAAHAGDASRRSSTGGAQETDRTACSACTGSLRRRTASKVPKS